MKPTTILATVLAGLATTAAVFGDIVKPLSATSSIAGNAGSNVNYLLEDNPGFAAAGLQEPPGTPTTIETGDTLAKAAATYAELSGGGHAESWTKETGDGNPVFVFDLGADTAIGSAVLWQYGNNGGGPGRVGNHTSDFELIFHTDAEGDIFDFGTETVEYNGTMEPAIAAVTEANVAQLFFFGAQETARYVALRIANNCGSHPDVVAGGDRYGLGEVRFATEAIHDPIISAPASINIGENDGSAETLMVDVINNGASQPLNVTNAVVTGPDSTAFTVTTDFSSPLVLAPAGGSGTIDIDFDPSGLVPGLDIDATLEIDSDDAVRPTIKIPIAGVVRDPWIDTVPVLDLGTVLPGAGVQHFTIDVNNAGTTNDLTVDGGFITTGPAFEVVDDLATTPLVVIAGGTGQVNLSFDPGGLAGVFTDRLELDSDDPVVATHYVDLTVTVERDPEISAPAVVDLGILPLGTGPQPFTVQVDNVGAANDLIISAADTIVGDAANFIVGSIDSPIVAGGNGVINVTFDPTGFTGNFSTILEITSNDLGVPTTTDVELRAIVEPHAPPAALPGGLVAWWSMDDELDPGKDDSENGFDGSPLGTPTSTNGANANTGNALSFSGTTHIDVPWSSHLNPESFTVTLWANPTNSTGSYASPITSRDDSGSGTPTYGYVLYNDVNGNWTFWTGDGDPGWHSTTNGGSVAINAWTHLAISYDAVTETKSIFVNGVLADSATVPPALYVPNGPQTEDLHLAAGQDAGDGFYFQGALDDVAVFNTALSETDINTVMNDGVAGFVNIGDTSEMVIVINGYDAGNLSVTVNNIPSGQTYHLEKSTDLLNFEILSPVFDFDSTTAWPQLIPTMSPKMFLQAYDGPSIP